MEFVAFVVEFVAAPGSPHRSVPRSRRACASCAWDQTTRRHNRTAGRGLHRRQRLIARKRRIPAGERIGAGIAEQRVVAGGNAKRDIRAVDGVAAVSRDQPVQERRRRAGQRIGASGHRGRQPPRHRRAGQRIAAGVEDRLAADADRGAGQDIAARLRGERDRGAGDDEVSVRAAGQPVAGSRRCRRELERKRCRRAGDSVAAGIRDGPAANARRGAGEGVGTTRRRQRGAGSPAASLNAMMSPPRPEQKSG